MTNKERLINNNTRIQECIDKANSLPSTKGNPIKITELDESLLIPENDGKLYELGDKLYQVKKITSLKGLTIKFNEHITDCPVIGEDDEFECSGIVLMDDFYEYSDGINDYKPSAIKITKKPIDSWWASNGVTYIDFVLEFNEQQGGYFELSYTLDNFSGERCWRKHDAYANVVPTLAPAVIYDFDCPSLNENQEFIKWVFENAKVYPNFRSSNDIESFKLDNTTMFRVDTVCTAYSLQDAFRYIVHNANRTGAILEYDIPGQYTASFAVNGEIVTKTFTNVNVDNWDTDGLPVFSNDTDELVFLFAAKDENGIININGELIPSPVKYNDVYMNGDITFTKFDFTHSTKTNFILSFILCYTTVSGEYNNGFAFEEYGLSPKEYDGTMEVK